jgi:hypothetical protein
MLCLDSLPLREKNKTQLKDHKNSISQWAFEVDWLKAHGTPSTQDKELGATTTISLAGPDHLAGLRQESAEHKGPDSQTLRGVRTTQACLVFVSRSL